MKIRTGFVSNSSSSSFVCIIKEKEKELFYESLENKEKEIFDYYFQRDKVLGENCFIMLEHVYDEYLYEKGWDKDFYILMRKIEERENCYMKETE